MDFFPPVVDDPFQFGAIAAANALSDIYAMGAKPLFALNLVGFPKEQPLKVLSKILAGGQAKADEAGIPILGGHSIQDPEPKYGLAVTGSVHPKRVLTNAGAKRGRRAAAHQAAGLGHRDHGDQARARLARSSTKRAVALMRTLNQAAGEVFASGQVPGERAHGRDGLRAARAPAGDDDGREHAGAGGPGAHPASWRACLRSRPQGVVPGGTKANLAHVAKRVRFPEGLPEDIQWVLADAQTNGGLLAAVPARDVPKALRALERAGVDAALIGEVVAGRPGIDVLG